MERSVFFIYDAISQIIKEPPNLVKSFVVFQLLSYVWLFATPRTAALQASLSFTISQTLLNSCALSWWCHPTISSSVAPFSSCPHSFPASGSFPVNWLFASCGQSIGASASTSDLAMNIQCWFPLELTGLIFLLSKGLSRIFSSTAVHKHQFFRAQPSLWSNSHPYMTTGKAIGLTRQAFVGKVISLPFNTLSRFVIAFLPRSKHLIISQLQSPSTVILVPKKIQSATISTFSPSICHEVMEPDAMIFVFLNVKL